MFLQLICGFTASRVDFLLLSPFEIVKMLLLRRQMRQRFKVAIKAVHKTTESCVTNDANWPVIDEAKNKHSIRKERKSRQVSSSR